MLTSELLLPPSTRQNTHMCTYSDVLRPTSAGHCRAQPPGGDKLQTSRTTEQRETRNPSPLTTYQAPLDILQRPTQTRHPNKVSQAHSDPHTTHNGHIHHTDVSTHLRDTLYTDIHKDTYVTNLQKLHAHRPLQ